MTEIIGIRLKRSGLKTPCYFRGPGASQVNMDSPSD